MWAELSWAEQLLLVRTTDAAAPFTAQAPMYNPDLYHKFSLSFSVWSLWLALPCIFHWYMDTNTRAALRFPSTSCVLSRRLPKIVSHSLVFIIYGGLLSWRNKLATFAPAVLYLVYCCCCCCQRLVLYWGDGRPSRVVGRTQVLTLFFLLSIHWKKVQRAARSPLFFLFFFFSFSFCLLF